MTSKIKKIFEKQGYCVIKNCIPQQDIHSFLDRLENKSTDEALVESEEG
jgi:ectoine hydroxylase-related dioxygenase (phytanoyl-CoA dioxygenase family)